MKRRQFGLMAGSSAAAFAAATALTSNASAAVSADKAALLKTTLTPFGAERAGNADGSIPAWTGGVSTIPAGWTPDMIIMPDIYADDPMLFKITAANMDQYKDQLSVGVMAMMQKVGFSINVYPTHRPAVAPQYVYDNTYQNALTAKPDPRGGRFGFSGAYGGIPFPIPDEDENQGVEIIWNHLCRWVAHTYTRKISTFTVNQGHPALGVTLILQQEDTYFDPNGNLASFDGVLSKLRNSLLAPSPLYGQEIISITYTNPVATPNQSWELLPGQGRVRKAPELEFDTPSPGSSGFLNFDEVQGFLGSPQEYNWKSLGKREMFIPYCNNGMGKGTPEQLLQPHFVNPDFVRWERHRVWVVDATLAPGERNVVPHRRFYVDEDTWTVALVDEYDAQGNLWKCNINYNELRPDVPSLQLGGSSIYDLQSDQYNMSSVPLNDPNYSSPVDLSPIPIQRYSPQDMAAQAQY